jgi:hypothetical protein
MQEHPPFLLRGRIESCALADGGRFRLRAWMRSALRGSKARASPVDAITGVRRDGRTGEELPGTAPRNRSDSRTGSGTVPRCMRPRETGPTVGQVQARCSGGCGPGNWSDSRTSGMHEPRRTWPRETGPTVGPAGCTSPAGHGLGKLVRQSDRWGGTGPGGCGLGKLVRQSDQWGCTGLGGCGLGKLVRQSDRWGGTGPGGCGLEKRVRQSDQRDASAPPDTGSGNWSDSRTSGDARAPPDTGSGNWSDSRTSGDAPAPPDAALSNRSDSQTGLRAVYPLGAPWEAGPTAGQVRAALRRARLGKPVRQLDRFVRRFAGHALGDWSDSRTSGMRVPRRIRSWETGPTVRQVRAARRRARPLETGPTVGPVGLRWRRRGWSSETCSTVGQVCSVSPEGGALDRAAAFWGSGSCLRHDSRRVGRPALLM